MAQQQNGLSWDEHRALAAELREVRERLHEQATRLAGAYGPTSQAGREARRARDVVDRLRWELDGVVAGEYPDQAANAGQGGYLAAGERERIVRSTATGKVIPGVALDEANQAADEDRRWGMPGG